MAHGSYKSHVAGSQRVFDHMYDKNYVTSGPRDVWRANNIALAKSAPVHIFPVYKTMFTDLPRAPRNMYVMQQNPLPHYSYYTGGDHNRQQVPTNIHGADRSKFFYNPRTHGLEMPSIKIYEKPETVDDNLKVREMACQTMYRVSSAQTKPWQPRAEINANERETPEIVYVADMLKSDHLPGKYEADVVERSRKKRHYQKALPKLMKGKPIDGEKHTINAFEWENFLAREDEIDGSQAERMRMLEEMFKAREKKMKAIADTRIRNFQNKSSIANEKKKNKLKSDHQRDLRKLEMKHKKIGNKYKTTDIAIQHIDRASDLYGPLMRFGEHPRQKHFEVFKTYYEPRLNTITHLDVKPDAEKYINSKEKMWDPKPELKEIMKGLWDDKYLAELYNSLLKFRKTQEKRSKPTPDCLQLIPVDEEDEVVCIDTRHKVKNEQEFLDALLLQKIIRGRAIQNNINKGRSSCKSLIEEIKLVHELRAIKDMMDDKGSEVQQNRVEMQYQQSRRQGLKRIYNAVREIPEYCEGMAISFMFNFLAAEQTRENNEEQFDLLREDAMKERYKREAVESGRRQIEEIKRRDVEQQYNEAMKIKTVKRTTD